jgi:hypothetical protein
MENRYFNLSHVSESVPCVELMISMFFFRKFSVRVNSVWKLTGIHHGNERFQLEAKSAPGIPFPEQLFDYQFN